MPGRCIIRKPLRKWILLAAALLSALGYALLRPARVELPAPCARLLAASEGLDAYEVTASLDAGARTLSVTQTMRLKNRAGETLPDVVVRTFAGAYASEDTSPAATEELYDACYPDGFSAGDIALFGVWWNGTIVETAFDDDARTVLRVPVGAWAAGDAATLEMRYVLTIPECAHRFGVSGGVWRLGNCLPVLSLYENGAWRTDAYCPVGDPFVSGCANWRVTLRVPEGFVCAGSADGRATTAEGYTTYAFEALAARDFALAVSDRYVSRSAMQGNVKIACFCENAADAGRVIGYAQKAVACYEKRYGEYPYQQLSLAAVDFPFGGMEYPGLIFFSQAYLAKDYQDTLELVVAHEAAHQWFYALVGSDQFNQPWQDEALCEYAVLRYVSDVYGQSASRRLYEQRVETAMRVTVLKGVTPGSPIDYFSDLSEYTTVVYNRGAALLEALRLLLGEDALDGFLRAYCERFAYGYASRADFERTLHETTGVDASALLLDYLDTYIQN